MTRILQIWADLRGFFDTDFSFETQLDFTMELLHEDLTDKILKAFYEVYNDLKYGFKEKIYQKSMLLELRKVGLYVEEEKDIPVFYKQHQVGLYRADLVVENKLILELKAQRPLKTPSKHSCFNT